jgi:alpha-glucosidase
MQRKGDINAIYQIYPRSFKDSNADGVGDLPGIVSKLDYLKSGSPDSLGVDAIWMSPFYPSPMEDFGYDISNFCDVDPLFGTLEDMDELINEAHEREIAVIVDIVPNHSSSEHPWFKEAASSLESPFRDYYIFRDPAEDGGPPNNWLSVFGGSAWEYDDKTKQYYLHSFLKEQPDLNWENPAVQEEMRGVIRFWFDRGVDGIRVDAIRWMGKNVEFLDDPRNDSFREGQDPYHAVEHHYSRFSPELDDYLKVMTSVAHEYDDKIIIFEDHLDSLTPTQSQVQRMYAIDPGVSAPFNFQAMHTSFNSRAFSDMVNTYQSYLTSEARAFYCFSNHDESRLATRFGEKEARMLAVLQLALPGTPVLYNGQELGMTDGIIPADKIQDPFEKRVPGKGLGRDPARTPIQWDSSPNAGFTDAETGWLPVNSTYNDVNVMTESKDPSSSLMLYKDLLALTKEYAALRDGAYEHAYTDDNIFMFWRYDENSRFLTVLNFTNINQGIQVPNGGVAVISAQSMSYPEVYSGNFSLTPLDGVIIQYQH